MRKTPAILCAALMIMSAVAAAADNLITPGSTATPKLATQFFLQTNSNKLVPATMAFTTDGNSNIIPIGSAPIVPPPGGMRVNQGDPGTSDWLVNDAAANLKLSSILGQLDVPLSSRASESTLAALSAKIPAGLSVSGGRLLVDIDSPTITALQGTSPWLTSRNWTLSNSTDSVGAAQLGAWSTGRTWSLTFAGDKIDASGSSVSASQLGAWTTGRTWNLGFAGDKVDASGSSVSVSNFPATFGAPGAAAPANAQYVEGLDGGGLARAVSVDASGSVNTNVLSSALPTGAATAANQTNGAQKTHIVDGSGTTIGPAQVVHGSNALPVSTPARVTFSAAAANSNPGNGSNDVCVLGGSGTKTVRVRRVAFSGTVTTGASIIVQLIKRSTADTGGVSTALTAVNHDSTEAAATASALAYSTAPTVGAAVGAVRSELIFMPTTATMGSAPLVFEFGARQSEEPIVLRGTAQQLAIFVIFGGGGNPGARLNCEFEWTEE